MPNRSILDEREAKPARSFGSPMGTPIPGTTTAQRPKAGPADAVTRRTAVNKQLAEREPVPKAEKPYKRPTSIDRENPTKDITVGTAAKRLRERRLTLQDAEDEALN